MSTHSSTDLRLYFGRKENADQHQKVAVEQQEKWYYSLRKENTDTLEEVAEEERGEVDNDIIWELKKKLMILGPSETINRWQHWRIRWQRHI